jgi:hypothetical protein
VSKRQQLTETNCHAVSRPTSTSLLEASDPFCNRWWVSYTSCAVWQPSDYIGQTTNSALHRFQQHVTSARHPEQKKNDLPVYNATRRYGLEDFFILPLEKISYRVPVGEGKNQVFREAATPREIFGSTDCTAGAHGVQLRPLGSTRQANDEGADTHATTPRGDTARYVVIVVVVHVRFNNGGPSLSGTGADRRLAYLCRTLEAHQWEQVRLQPHSRNTLRKVTHHLQLRLDQKCHETKGVAFSPDSVKTVLHRLRQALYHLKPPEKKAPKIKDPTLFRVKRHSNLFDRVQLTRILKQTEGWPLGPECKQRLVLSRVLPSTTGGTVCNYTGAAKHFEDHQQPGDTCPCVSTPVPCCVPTSRWVRAHGGWV